MCLLSVLVPNKINNWKLQCMLTSRHQKTFVENILEGTNTVTELSNQNSFALFK